MVHATVRKCSEVVAFLGGRGRGIQYIRDSNPRSSCLEVGSLPLGKTVVFLKFFLITLLSSFLRIDFHTPSFPHLRMVPDWIFVDANKAYIYLIFEAAP